MLLVKHNANVHSKSASGDTALHVAAAQGSVAALEALLSEVRVSTASTLQSTAQLNPQASCWSRILFTDLWNAMHRHQTTHISRILAVLHDADPSCTVKLLINMTVPAPALETVHMQPLGQTLQQLPQATCLSQSQSTCLSMVYSYGAFTSMVHASMLCIMATTLQMEHK